MERRNSALGMMAMAMAMGGGMGMTKIFKDPKPFRTCGLEGCNIQTDHNHGFCCAAHCRQDRENRKPKRYFLHERTGSLFAFRRGGNEEIDNVTLADCLRDTEYFKELSRTEFNLLSTKGVNHVQ